MQRPDDWRLVPRVLFESLEDRLALTVNPAADFWLDQQTLEIAIEQHDRRIEPHEIQGGTGGSSAIATQDFHLTGRGQTVAIIDSGIGYDHVALGGGYGTGHRVVGGWDFAENDADPYDDGPAGFHGTHVAGIIGADDSRHAGLASGVDLVALRVFDDQGNGYFSWVEKALQWVHERRTSFANPITTVNLSLGAEWNAAWVPSWATLEDELRQLEQDGIFIAVSAGNSFQEYAAAGLSYPAASQYVVPVASVAADGSLSRFTQRSDRVLAAPGERITSTVPDHYYGGDGIKNDWGAASGTSMAAPYVAGASVLVRQAMQSLGQTLVTQDGIYELLRNTSDVVYDSATHASYRRVNLDRALSTLYGSASGSHGDLGRTVSWGTVEFARHDNVAIAGDAWFQVTAGRSGMFTAEATWQAAGNVQLEFYDAARHLVTGGSGAAGRQRLDAAVTAGQTYYVRARGTSGDIDFRLTNLVSIGGSQTEVFGTADSDTFAWSGGTSGQIAVNGVTYSLGSTRQVAFHGGGGNDSLQITGTAAAETATLRVGSVTFVGPRYGVNADAVETIRVSGGAADQALLYDSTGNDYFDAGPRSALMRGNGYYNFVERFGSVNASATSGGYDRANLYDSGASDWFDAGPASALMRGSDYFNRAEGFDEVNAYAIWGGFDQANLYGSSGSDRLELRGTSRVLVGAGYRLRADQFEQVRTYGQGGIDQALLYDLGNQDHFYGRRNFGRLTAAAVATELWDFESALAYDRAGQHSGADVKALEYIFRQISG